MQPIVPASNWAIPSRKSNWPVTWPTAPACLNEGSVELVIKELRDAILFFNRLGRAVKIEGLGTYTPGIDLGGTFDVQYRADTDLKGGLNARNTFSGTIRYRENIGKSASDLVALWNGTHPDDPVT